jgi:hypothetical protein
MRIGAFLIAFLLATSNDATGQSLPATRVWGEVSAGDELETYLRVLQSLGAVPLYPWGARAFSPREVETLAPADSGHPWAHRYSFRRSARRLDFVLLRPAATSRFNSGFPYGANDGPVWAGRGLTSAVEAGIALRYGGLSLTLAPLAFRAENAAFRLMPTGQTGRFSYADALYGGIDLPQRFGAGPYTLLDPGQSSLRLDAGGVTVGFSTANEYWGPAREYPILLGNNAAGFPHAFLGTETPLDLRVVRLHGHILWGRLTQSDYSLETVTGGLRFAVGAVALLTSHYVPGLEIGVERFAHRPWRADGPTLGDLVSIFQSQYRANAAQTAQDNQLAAVFFRWVLPHSGFDVYGEYGRDDYNQNLRDLVEEPDHIGGYTVGLAKAHRSGAALRVFRAELQDLQFSVLAQGRGWAPFYTSGSLRQGHTERGQILGSYAGFGGAGAILAVDTYYPGGRWTVSWSRVLRRHRGGFADTGVADPAGLDVIHAVAWSAVWFRGRYDLTGGVTAVYEFNRDFQRDAFNLNLSLGARAQLP